MLTLDFKDTDGITVNNNLEVGFTFSLAEGGDAICDDLDSADKVVDYVGLIVGVLAEVTGLEWLDGVDVGLDLAGTGISVGCGIAGT
jgi:hypothetical protein